MPVADVLHKVAVVGLVGTTIVWGSFIPRRLWEVNVKAKELEEYANGKGISFKEAAQELGYQPVDDRWIKKK